MAQLRPVEIAQACVEVPALSFLAKYVSQLRPRGVAQDCVVVPASFVLTVRFIQCCGGPLIAHLDLKSVIDLLANSLLPGLLLTVTVRIRLARGILGVDALHSLLVP